MGTKEINDNLVAFWNQAISLDEEYKKEVLKASDFHVSDIAPSEKLYLSVKELGTCSKVLDYGCGTGWAACTAAEAGCNDVLAVDLGENIIEYTKFHAERFGLQEKVKTLVVDSSWIKSAPSCTFDGLVCSNVLDVLPLETSMDIIKEIARITKSGATIIIGLNFYLSKEMAEARNMQLVDDMYLFVNDVLRLTSLSDDEWKNLFAPYFKVMKLDYFAWEGEPKESRRLFILKKK